MDASNTVSEQAEKPKRKGQFAKGDPRINRKGRPKSFDKLRALAQALANEPAIDAKTRLPIVIDGHIATQAEMILRSMMKENAERFVEIAYGKVPQPVEISGKDGAPVQMQNVPVTPEELRAEVERAALKVAELEALRAKELAAAQVDATEKAQ